MGSPRLCSAFEKIQMEQHGVCEALPLQKQNEYILLLEGRADPWPLDSRIIIKLRVYHLQMNLFFLRLIPFEPRLMGPTYTSPNRNEAHRYARGSWGLPLA